MVVTKNTEADMEVVNHNIPPVLHKEQTDKIRLSVVIPVKNEENYLGKCLKYLVRSIVFWGGEAEIIIVDNESVDQSVQIAESYECKILVESNGTIGKLRNIGSSHSNGEIIAFLDADCIVSEKWVQYCLQNFEKDEIGAVGTRAVPDLDNGTWVEKGWYNLVNASRKSGYVNWLGTSNLFVKKDLFFQVGGFDESLITAEDSELGYRINKKKKILLDTRIDTIHLRESKTLKELFRREIWRGRNSFKSLQKNHFNFNEIPSVLVPVVFLFSSVCFPLYLAFGCEQFLIISLLVIVLPVMFMLRKKVTIYSFKSFFECYIISMVYLLARSAAFFLRSDRG